MSFNRNPKRFLRPFSIARLSSVGRLWYIFLNDQVVDWLGGWDTRERAEDCLRGFLGLDIVLPDSGPWKFGANHRFRKGELNVKPETL